MCRIWSSGKTSPTNYECYQILALVSIVKNCIYFYCWVSRLKILLSPFRRQNALFTNAMFQHLWGNSFYPEKYNNMVDGCVKEEDSIEKTTMEYFSEHNVPGKVIPYYKSKLDDRIKMLLIIWLKCYFIFSASPDNGWERVFA